MTLWVRGMTTTSRASTRMFATTTFVKDVATSPKAVVDAAQQNASKTTSPATRTRAPRSTLPMTAAVDNALVPNETRFQTRPTLKPMQFFNSFAPYSDFGYPPPPFTVLGSPTLLAIKDPLLIYHKVFLSSLSDKTHHHGSPTGSHNPDRVRALDYNHKTYVFPAGYDYESPFFYETKAGQLVLNKDFVPAFHDPFGNLGKVDFEEPLYVDITSLDRGVATRVLQLYGDSLTTDERLQLSLNMTAAYRRRKITTLVSLLSLAAFLYYYSYTHTEYQSFEDIPMPPLPEPPKPLASTGSQS